MKIVNIRFTQELLDLTAWYLALGDVALALRNRRDRLISLSKAKLINNPATASN